MMNLESEIVELRERTSRIETSIETLIKQQTAVEKIADSVQEIALSVKELTVQTNSNTKRLEEVDNDSKKKIFYIWCTVIGGVLGAVITYLMKIFA